MQFFGESLNNISKFRRHEKASRIRRNAFGLVMAILTEPPSDETRTFQVTKNYFNQISWDFLRKY